MRGEHPGEVAVVEEDEAADDAGVLGLAALDVLVVEDSPSDRLLMVEALRDAGVAPRFIVTASSLRDAREALSGRRFGCVMLDLSLPDASGLEAVRVLASASPHLPIIVVSGRPADDVVYAAMAEGADEYLCKDDLEGPRLRDLLVRAKQRRAGSRRNRRLWTDAARALATIASPAVALDGQGRIIAVNQRWSETARAGRASSLSTGLGVNYLTICDQAAGPFSGGAKEAAAGIRSVLLGDVQHFTLDYPCPTDGRDRWFSLRATHLGEVGGGVIVTHLDITDLKLAEHSLRGSGRWFPTLDASAPVFGLLTADGVVEHLSEATVELLGLEDRPLRGLPLFDQLEPTNAVAVAAALDRVAVRDNAQETATLHVRDGEDRWRQLDVTLTNLLHEPSVAAITVVGSDVSDSRRIQIVRQLEPRLLELLPMPMAIVDAQGVVVHINDQAEEMIGYSRAQVVGRSTFEMELGPSDPAIGVAIAEALQDQGRWDGEYDLRLADGALVPVRSSMETLRDAEIDFDGILVGWLDISERRQLEGDLSFQALHDPLTGLPNRRLFLDHLELALARSGRVGGTVAVMVANVDGFRAINDLVGHDAADEVLCALGAVITGGLRTGDLAARLGGGELVVSYGELADPAEAVELAQAMLDAIGVPLVVAGERFPVTACLGLAMATPGVTGAELIRQAQAAVQEAKAAGSGRLQFFDDVLNVAVRRRHCIAAELDHAIESGALRTEFQPQHDLRTGTLVGFEALARWTHPTEGPLGPDEFIPIAEGSGRIGRLGRKVLADACRELRRWMDARPEQLVKVAVNVSPRQLGDPRFPQTIAEVLHETGVPAGRLCLEITESSLVDLDLAAETMRQLKEVGVEIAIDDFGTGYSSLSRLHRFPLDYLKIDRTFVSGMTARPEDEMIAKLIIGLAHALGVTVIAEGIEDEHQLDRLASMGCELGQGYLYGAAASAGEALQAVTEPAPMPCAHPGADGLDDAPGADALDTDSAVAVLAHELAAPITVISSAVDLLRSPADDLAGDLTDAEVFAAIERAAARARAAIELVRDASAAHSGSLCLDRSATTVASVVHEAIEALVDRPADLTVEVGDIAIQADHHRLVAVVANLLSNAQRHAPGAHVDVVAIDDPGAGRVAVHVRDDGPGVRAEQVGTIFRRFGQANPRSVGSGLGLYVARAIARSHGGDLRYLTNPRGGAHFVLEIPTVGSHDAAPAG